MKVSPNQFDFFAPPAVETPAAAPRAARPPLAPPHSVRAPDAVAASVLAFKPDPLMCNEALGPDVEVGTAVGARLLGVSPRTLRAYCDEDVLREGAHWRRNTPRSPYLIRRRAIIAKSRAWF